MVSYYKNPEFKYNIDLGLYDYIFYVLFHIIYIYGTIYAGDKYVIKAIVDSV